jgi:MazG family protein
MPETGKKFEELVGIMARLRGPGGCPWDKEQTYKDIAVHTLEEVHEALDAIDRKDYDGLKEELGDLLLQVVFYAQIAQDEGRWKIDDVLDVINKKLIHRHPHVFGEKKAKDSKEVLKRWESLKLEEGKKSVLGGVPKVLPALLKAYRLGEKAARVGFDWEDAEGILGKLEEEARELHEARKTKDESQIEREYGDLLFTLANIGRFLGIDPEGALRKSSDRFIRRFQFMEKEIAEKKLDMRSLSAKEWDELWERAKNSKS